MESHNNQKKIAIINDFSGFGRCSITVALPVISAMKVQCCALPTSVFSNHTAFDSYYFDDFTAKMEPYMAEWKKLDLHFEGICTGFLGSKEQIDLVKKFLEEFTGEETMVLVDPVMGDYGQAYATYTPAMCQEMKKLVRYADILTPNLTEACILTDTPYKENWKMEETAALAEKLCAMGARKVVISGIPQGSFLTNLCYEQGQEVKLVRTKKVGPARHGTGDIFSAVIAADVVNGALLEAAVRKAAIFIKKCIITSIEREIPMTDGVCFEDHLGELAK
ncbi:MAG: pyridoxamine kinase [Clostridiales bacterium]|nr:pyridoxamine kinase [Clostridiales bacterium]